MDINSFLKHIKDTLAQVQQRAANTPVSPLGVTPQQMMNFQAPLEEQANNMNPLLKSVLGPITQVPSFVGENVRQVGRFAGLQPNTMDIATAPLMFMGGVKATTSKKMGMQDVKVALDAITEHDQLLKANPSEYINKLQPIEQMLRGLADDYLGKNTKKLSMEEVKNALYDRVMYDTNMGAYTKKIEPTMGVPSRVPPSIGGEIPKGGGMGSIKPGKPFTPEEIAAGQKQVLDDFNSSGLKIGQEINLPDGTKSKITKVDGVLDPTSRDVTLFLENGRNIKLSQASGEIGKVKNTYPLKPEQKERMYLGSKEVNDEFVKGLIAKKQPISASFIDKAPEGYVLVKNKTYGDPVEYVYKGSQAEIGKGVTKEADLLKKLKDANLTGK